ncbi:hypothetical protein [Neobacillus drentensis]|uniref:hypothetical protein n=1 Tax=Neobacillus drentensis TaxID=220684 RepID=UPI00285F57C7|nr:hypothetical protein [Neobacillus drentensis]MDR7237318.1 hypothetical protein [Neobacillus drentensis]
MEQEKQKWYLKTDAIVLFLLFFPLIGLILLWNKNNKIKFLPKVIVTVIYLGLFALAFISTVYEPDSESVSTDEIVNITSEDNRTKDIDSITNDLQFALTKSSQIWGENWETPFDSYYKNELSIETLTVHMEKGIDEYDFLSNYISRVAIPNSIVGDDYKVVLQVQKSMLYSLEMKTNSMQDIIEMVKNNNVTQTKIDLTFKNVDRSSEIDEENKIAIYSLK